MAAQAGAASNRPGASGRKRSWNPDPPAVAKNVRVEAFGVSAAVLVATYLTLRIPFVKFEF